MHLLPAMRNGLAWNNRHATPPCSEVGAPQGDISWDAVESSLCSSGSWRPQGILGSPLDHARVRLCFTEHSAQVHLCIQVAPFHNHIHHVELHTTRKTLPQRHQTKALFPNKVPFTVLGNGVSAAVSGKHTLSHNIKELTPPVCQINNES